MGDPWYTTAFGAHYPLLYRHRDAAEARQCLDLLPRLAPLVTVPGQPVLDLGCGDGRHLDLLIRAGYQAVGLDLSWPLLQAARARRSARPVTPLIRGDMRQLPLQPAACGAVLSLFTAFGYFGPPATNRGPVAEIARVLVPGGHWFLDYFDGDRVRAELEGSGPSVRRRELGPLQVREERTLDSAGSVVTKAVRLTPRPGQGPEAERHGIHGEGLEYTEQVALFTLPELEALAAAEGLVQVAGAGDYGGAPLGSGPRWILVFRKSSKVDMV